MKKAFLVLMIPFFIISCADEKSEDTPTPSSPSVVNIPPIIVSCSTATNCADNSANGKTVSAFYFDSSTQTVYAYGTASVSCGGGTCTGTINSWTDSSLTNTVSTINAGNYNVSIGIDMDGNLSSSDSGEPNCYQYVLAKVTIDSSTTSLTPSPWTDK